MNLFYYFPRFQGKNYTFSRRNSHRRNMLNDLNSFILLLDPAHVDYKNGYLYQVEQITELLLNLVELLAINV